MIRHLLILLIFVHSSILFGAGFNISAVKVKCLGRSNCSGLVKSFSSLRRTFSSRQHFYSVLKLYVAYEGISSFDFEINSIKNKKTLFIMLDKKSLITDVSSIKFLGRNSVDFPDVLPLRTGKYLDIGDTQETIKLLKDISHEKGFPSVEVNKIFKFHKDGVDIKFEVDLGAPIVVKSLTVNSSSIYLKSFVRKKIGYHVGSAFDVQKLKLEVESLRKSFHFFGYYLIDFALKYKYKKNNTVELYLDLLNLSRYSFYFDNVSSDTEFDLKKYLAKDLIASKREFDTDTVSTLLKDKFQQRGFRNPNFKVVKKTSIDINSDKSISYTITSMLGHVGRVKSILFKGINHFKREDLIKLYYERSSGQAKEDIIDNDFYVQFVELLREKYISEGLVSVFVDKPSVARDKDEMFTITFKVREGVKTILRSLKITGVSSQDEDNIKKLLNNKVARSFNPISFKIDLDIVDSYLKSMGYYYSRILNLRNDDLVQYENDNSRVNININVYTGPKLYVDNVIIIGNHKTRNKLIRRELSLKKGSLITSKKLEESHKNLLKLGIFGSIQIKPVSRNTSRTDILVFVREKDFGAIEIVPGIRSDLGLKLAALISYNNLEGMNKKVNFKGTVNQRYDLSTLDDVRTKAKPLVEFDFGVNYFENHLFHSQYNFSSTLIQARKRLFSYDVDIKRVGFTLAKDFSNWFNYSIRFQLEQFSQYNATDDKNHGEFRIGSMTTSANADFRNRNINPSSGAFFNLSVELANPALLSQSNEDLVIDYYKIISRSRFYIPITQKSTFAISTAFGLQENLATDTNAVGRSEGYIPNIKVFRLSGADRVRGYENEEINTLITGQDISDVEVNSTAYMANIKLEPRYYLSDSTILALFYDAGRVFVGEFISKSLRSSVGVSFKFITPVGTLDIDYGIKTLRKKDSSGNLEAPGKLHVSIGFF